MLLDVHVLRRLICVLQNIVCDHVLCMFVVTCIPSLSVC